MIKPFIKEGVKGYAIPIVLLSEGSHVDCAIFNCITHILYDRPCESTDEVQKVWEIQIHCERQIMAFLKAIKVPVGECPRRFKLVEEEHAAKARKVQ